MYAITDDSGTLYQGTKKEMELAYEYMTKPGWKLAEKYGYSMDDLFLLNKQYYTTWKGKLKLKQITKLKLFYEEIDIEDELPPASNEYFIIKYNGIGSWEEGEIDTITGKNINTEWQEVIKSWLKPIIR